MKVLLAVDDSAYSEEAVSEVAARSWPSGTMVRVLNVVEKFVPPAAQLWYDAGGNLDLAREQIKDRATQMLNGMAQMLRTTGVMVETVVRDGKPGKVIIDEAKEWGADLIIVGSHGHSSMKRILLGSVAQQVIDHAPCSVEVAHQRREDPKGGS